MFKTFAHHCIDVTLCTCTCVVKISFFGLTVYFYSCFIFAKILRILMIYILFASAGLPRSLPTADQCQSITIKIAFIEPNADQFQSLPIFTNALLMPRSGIERYFGSLPGFWLALIGIGHWESCISWLREISLEGYQTCCTHIIEVCVMYSAG